MIDVADIKQTLWHAYHYPMANFNNLALIPVTKGKGTNGKNVENSNCKFKNLELLFMELFKFSSYYSNSWHYSKYQVLFNFRI